MTTYSFYPPSQKPATLPAEQVKLAEDLESLVIWAKHQNKPFVLSLAACVLKAKRPWTDKQLYWAKKYHEELGALAANAASSKAASLQAAKEQAAQVASLTFPNITKLFIKVIDNLAYPKITYDLPDCRITLAYSATYGSIAIRVGNRSIGALNLTGAISKSYPVKDQKIIACLQEIEKDPVAAAKVSGKHTGTCCFCSRELTDARSVVRGYGGTCAVNWGLPWDMDKEEAEKLVRVDIDSAEL